MGTLLVEREGEGGCFLTALLRLVRPQQPWLLQPLSPTVSSTPSSHFVLSLARNMRREMLSERVPLWWVEIFWVFPPLPFSVCVCVCMCRRVCEAQLGGVCMLSERGTVSVH